MRVILFCGKSESSNIVYSFLKEKYKLEGIVLDAPISKKLLLMRRVKKLGYLRVFLQVAFMKVIIPLLKLESKKRRKELIADLDINSLNDFDNILRKSSINDKSVIEYVKSKTVDLIIVYGTRIIKKNILLDVGVPLINLHVGITPKYRGVHGGYWALVNKDKKHFGVTAHIVDPGIDTGSIISQRIISKSREDNFCTYPLLQLKEGLLCLEDAIDQIKDNKILILKNDLNSNLYFHPTITSYLFNRLFNGVK